MTLEVLDPSEKGDLFDPDTIRWVLDPKELPALWAAIRDSSEVVIDLETTGLDEYATGLLPSWPESARISMAALTLPSAASPDAAKPLTYVVALSHPDSPLRGQWKRVVMELCRVIDEADVPVTNANLKFDMRWLYPISGIDLTHLFAWDTQISSHLLDENSPTALKERAPDTFGVARWDDHDLSTPAASEGVPLYELGIYAARDTYWTWRLAVLHRTIMGVGLEGEGQPEPESADEIEDRRLGTLASWCAMPTSATLTAMEQRGFGLDRNWVRARLEEGRAVSDMAYKALVAYYPIPEHDHELDDDCESSCPHNRLSGDPSFAATSLWFREWTQQAVIAGDLKVTALTPTGLPQWSKSVLTRQAREGSPVAVLLLEHRAATKQAEFLNAWLAKVTPFGKIHTTYHAGRVVTGRLSSSDPNMQQVTRLLKPAFVPSPGFYIAELDYSQIELRIAAFISRCERMMQAYRDGLDLHTMLAAQIAGKPLEEVTPQERQGGKAGNFGFIYGMGAEGFREYAEASYDVHFTPEEAEDIRRAFFDTWDGLAKWHIDAVRRARQTGQVISPIGRVRRLPDIWDSNPRTSSHAERNAINSPVQGFASDLMQMSAASIEGRLPGFDPVPEVRLLGTVHDSIVAEVPIRGWQQATGRMMRRMLGLNPVLLRMGCDLDVPLAVEATCGTRWGLGDVGVIK